MLESGGCMPPLPAEGDRDGMAVWMSRARDEKVRGRAQYGGTVTALSLFGLETGALDAALMTAWSGDPEEPYLTRPWLARTAEDVLAAAGSK